MNYESYNEDPLNNFPVVDSTKGKAEPDNWKVIEQNKVKRLITGKLADDIRTRLNADLETPVFITETDTEFWVGDEGLTAANDYEMTISCAGVEKVFDDYSAYHNFAALLKWLKEAPGSPVEEDK